MGDHFGHPRGVHTIAMSGGGGGRVEGGGEGGAGGGGGNAQEGIGMRGVVNDPRREGGGGSVE